MTTSPDPFGVDAVVTPLRQQQAAQIPGAAPSRADEIASTHRLFERIPVALYRTSPDGEILDANEALADLLGYPDVDSLKGLNAADAYVDPAEREVIARRMHQEGLVRDYEALLKRRDGSEIWVRDMARVVSEGGRLVFEGALIDITERRRMESELRLRVRQQEGLAALGRHALETTDIVSVFTAGVDTVREVLGVELAGIVEAQPDGGFRFVATRGHERKPGDELTVERGRSLAEYAMAHGGPFFVDDVTTDDRFAEFAEHDTAGVRSAALTTIPTSTGVFGVVGALCTEPAAFGPGSAEFVESVATVVGAAIERDRNQKRLRELVRSKDEFVASVSHEVRTPLTVVVGLAEELGDLWRDLPHGEIDEFIGMITRESRDMSYLVEDLLVAARADIGTIPIGVERVALRNEVVRALAGITIPASCSVAVAAGDEIAAGDASRVRQIVRNLITNAVRYGGDRIDITFEATAAEVCVIVRDNGPGVPEGQLETIFDAYHRLDSVTSQPGSVGLGLSVSRQLARLMGGRLTCRNDGGAVFRLELPAAP